MSNAKRPPDRDKDNAERRKPAYKPLVWVSPYISEQDRVWLKRNSDSIPAVICRFLDELPLGYSVSCKYDNKSERWLAMCVCNEPNDVNDGCALTARASTRVKSLFILAYLHLMALEGNWGAASADEDDW